MLQSIGTLSASYSNRIFNARIRTDLNTLAQELTSGRKSDLRSALSGDMAPVAALERSLSRLRACDTVTAEADLFTNTLQQSLERIKTQIEGLTEAALAMENTTSPALIHNFGEEASSRFEALVGTLNTTVAGRSLFSGDDTESRAVADPKLILDDLATLLPGTATAEDVSAAVDAYFAPGGTFETARYLGSTDPLAPFRLTPEDTVSPGIDARQSELRAMLAATAKGALLARGALSGDIQNQSNLISIARDDLLGATAGIVALSASVGTAEARIDAARSRNGAETASLQHSLAKLVTADPYETATGLQAVQSQLDTFYTVTARLSQLNLTGYLR